MMSRLKPLPLVWFIAISNIFVTAAIIVLAVRSWHLQAGQHLPSDLRTPCVTIMGIFFVAGFCGEWLLARRVRSGAWPSASLESSRRLVSNPVVKAIPGAMFLFAILYFIASPINGLLSFFLFMCLPLSLTRLATTLKLKETDFTSTELSGSALHPAKPLRSNQWGH